MNAAPDLNRDHILGVCLATARAKPKISTTPRAPSGPVVGDIAGEPRFILAYDSLLQCHWADDALIDGPADTAAHTDAFARWYIAEFALPAGTYVPFEQAARRWNGLDRPMGRAGTASSTAHTEPSVSITDTPSGGTP